MKFILYISIGILLLLVIPYLVKTMPLKEIQKSDRPKEASLAPLVNGDLYYKWHQSEKHKNNGEILVLVHGFTTPSFVWGGVLEYFLEAGFKVLVYDHYGRGLSDRPRTKYTKEFYVETLKELLQYFNIEEPVHLLGYSMGGPIIGYFADAYPEKTRSITLIAPAGFKINRSGFNTWFIKPIIGEWFWHVFGNRIYGVGQMSETSSSVDPRSINEEEFLENFEKQLVFSGFVESLLSTIRNFNLFDAREMYKSIGDKGIPSFVAWGTKDGVVPYEGSKELLKAIPSAELLTITEGTHDITYRQPSQIGPPIVDFLSSH